MDEFCALRSKMYAYRTGDSVTKKLKGVKKCVLKKIVLFKDYKKCLFEQKEFIHKQRVIRSHLISFIQKK